MAKEIPTARDLEMQVVDAEIATQAILQTPRLQPASIARLVTLDEAIVASLKALEESGAGASAEADTLRQLHQRMLDTMRRISADNH